MCIVVAATLLSFHLPPPLSIPVWNMSSPLSQHHILTCLKSQVQIFMCALLSCNSVTIDMALASVVEVDFVSA